MLSLGNEVLSFEDALHHLRKPSAIQSTAAVTPKAGQAYFFRAITMDHKVEFTKDQYRFIYVGMKKHPETGVTKRYYKIKDPNLPGKQTLSGFQRFAYCFTENDKACGEPPVFLVHYVGDESLHSDHAHGNAKKKINFYLPTRKDVLEEVKNKSKSKKANEIYTDCLSEASKHSDQRHAAIDRPRDRKQVENICYNAKKNRNISNDEIFSAFEIALQTEKFVRKFELFPDLIIHVSHPELLQDTAKLIQLCQKQSPLKQVISYDTTFNIGDFYLSIVVCRNVLLKNDPIYPVAFMIHERKYFLHHCDFIKDVFSGMGLSKVNNIPVVTDRERGITKALRKHFPNLTNVFCSNHIIRDVDFWIKKHGGTSDDLKVYKDDIAQLIASESMEVFLDKVQSFESRWSESFREYFEKNLRGDLIRHGCDFITRKFPAFSEGAITNNISECMNLVLKSKIDYKELPVDAMILVLKQIQDIYHYDFCRSRTGIGQYQLKEEFDDYKQSRFDMILPPITKFECIVEEILSQDERPSRTIEKCPTYRMSQKTLARWCVKMDNISFSARSGAFIVTSPDGKSRHCVRYKPQPTCTCPSTGKCYHIFAVEIGLDDFNGHDKFCYSLSLMRKNRRGKQKAGRKRPRNSDYDYEVNPAPDALLHEKKSLQSNATSTPMKIDMPSPIKRYMPDFNVDVSTSGIGGNDTIDSTLLEAIMDVEGSCLEKSKDLEIEDQIYPWLNSDNVGEPVGNQFYPSLQGSNWLAEEVIELSVKKFLADVSSTDHKSTLLFDAFLYQCCKHEQSEPVASFAWQNAAANHDTYIVLVNPGGHWIVAVVDNMQHKIVIFDSLMKGCHKYKNIFSVLIKLVSATFAVANLRIDISDWQFVVCQDTPQQSNSYDCGLHVIVNIYCLMQKLALPQSIPSEKCRQWVSRLLASTPSGNISPLKPGKDIRKETAHKRVSKHWIKGFPEVELSYEHLADCHIFNSNQQGRWSVCEKNCCPGDMDSVEQVFCVLCSKWYHKKCIDKIFKGGQTYYVCEKHIN